MSRRLTIVIADDDLIVNAGLGALLETVDDLEVLERCSSLDQLLEAVEAHDPDVVVTDIRMPPTFTDEGVRAAKQLRTSHPNVGVVVLSQYVDPQLAMSVLGDGSRGRAYMLKEQVADLGRLETAIRAVAAGGSFVDSDVLDALTSSRQIGGNELATLSPRELEVMAEMAWGKSNASIAESLFVGERAVEKHISSIFSKFGLDEEGGRHRRVAAVLVYLSQRDHGLVE